MANIEQAKTVRAASDYCQALVARHDRQRYLAAAFLPAKARALDYLVLAFNAELAQVMIQAQAPTLQALRYAWWQEQLSALLDKRAISSRTISNSPISKSHSQPVLALCAKVLGSRDDGCALLTLMQQLCEAWSERAQLERIDDQQKLESFALQVPRALMHLRLAFLQDVIGAQNAEIFDRYAQIEGYSQLARGLALETQDQQSPAKLFAQQSQSLQRDLEQRLQALTAGAFDDFKHIKGSARSLALPALGYSYLKSPQDELLLSWYYLRFLLFSR